MCVCMRKYVCINIYDITIALYFSLTINAPYPIGNIDTLYSHTSSVFVLHLISLPFSFNQYFHLILRLL